MPESPHKKSVMEIARLQKQLLEAKRALGHKEEAEKTILQRLSEVEAENQQLQKKGWQRGLPEPMGQVPYDHWAEATWKFIEAQANDIVIRFGSGGKVRSVATRNFAKLLGFQPAEWIGRDIVAMFVPEEQEGIRQKLNDVPVGQWAEMSHQHFLSKITYDAPRMDLAIFHGVKEWVLWAAPSTVEVNVAGFQDLASSVVHELRQPLAAILNYSQACHHLVASDAWPRHEVAEALAQTVQQAERAGRLLGELKNIARLNKTERSPLAVNELVLETAKLLDLELKSQQVGLECQLADDLPLVHANRTQIGLVLGNLMKNGMEAMSQTLPAHRRLQVATTRHEQEVHVAVRDFGEGLSVARIRNLFEAYHSTKEGGLGIGLALCRAILQAHGGRIWARSIGGQGTIFTFALRRDSQP